jgi:tRNA-specific adenosine deaminase 2
MCILAAAGRSWISKGLRLVSAGRQQGRLQPQWRREAPLAASARRWCGRKAFLAAVGEAAGTEDADFQLEPAAATTGGNNRRRTAQQGVVATPQTPAMEDSVAHDMMGLALEEAALALAEREVPVGCVFVAPAPAPATQPLVLARAHNRTNALYSPLAHAEMVALDALVAGLPPCSAAEGGSDPLPRLRAALAGATLLVTVEPCIMCADALAKAGVRSVVYGCRNDKFGGCGTVVDVFCGAAAGSAAAAAAAAPRSVRNGVRAEEAVALLKRFYSRSNERAPPQ